MDGGARGMADAAAGESSSAGTDAGGTGNVGGGAGGTPVEGGVGGGSPGGGGNAGSGGEEPTERSVTGTVVALNEMPVPGAHVRIAGKDVVADENGVFTAIVGAAYDAAVFGNDERTRQVSIYLGLTRSNPKLYATPVPLIHGPQLSGVVTGQLPVSGATKTGTRVYVTGPFMNDPFSAMMFKAENDGSFQPKNDADEAYTPVWFGPDQVEGTLFAVQSRWAVLGPPAIVKVGSKSIHVTRDGTWNPSDGAIELVDAQGYRFVPSNGLAHSQGSSCQLVLALAGYDQMDPESCDHSFHEGPPGFQAQSLPTALRYSLRASGTMNDHTWSLERSYAGDADEFPVKFPKGVPTAEGPEGAVSDAAAALWHLTPAPESIISLRLTWSNDGEHVALVHTEEKKVSLARLFDAGLQLLPGEAVEWAAQGHVEASSMDAYAAPERLARDGRSTIDADKDGSPKHGLTYDPPTVAP